MAADFGYGNGGLGLRMAVRNSDMPTLKRFCKEASDANDAALLLEPAQTFREWTALHIAAWGALKDPKKAKDVVELLLQTAKKCGVEPEYRAAVASDKATALDLAKERRERIISVRTDDPNDLELKRNLDKVIEWLDKGLPDE